MRANIILLVFVAIAVFFAQAATSTDPPGCTHARVHGATLGTQVITDAIAHSYNLGERTFKADVAAYGAEAGSTLTIVYEKCGNLALQTSLDGASITLP